MFSDSCVILFSPMQATVDPAAQLRSKRSLRSLKGAEQGCAARDLPPGVYGFTYSPAFDSTPLFAPKSWRSFEFHKLADGSTAIVGYVSAEHGQVVRRNTSGTIRLYPDAGKDATELVSISFERMAHSPRTPAREEGCPYTIDLL